MLIPYSYVHMRLIPSHISDLVCPAQFAAWGQGNVTRPFLMGCVGGSWQETTFRRVSSQHCLTNVHLSARARHFVDNICMLLHWELSEE